MNRIAALVVVAGLLVAGLVRAEGPPAVGGAQIGVVDLDKVATEMGWMTEMRENIEKLKSQFRADLSRVQGGQEATIAQKRKDLGLTEKDNSSEEITKKLTQAQQQELIQVINASRQKLFQLQQSANQQLQSYETTGVRQYRDAVAPVVKKVAQAKKMLLVLSQANGTILYLDSTIDLSADVIKELKASPPVLNNLPLPHLEGTAETTQPALAPVVK